MMDKFEWSLVVAPDGEINAKYVACDSCRHLLDNDKCDAFPDGIPEPILTGEHDHTKPYPGDGGIRYEALEKGE